jgi:hypothetical protein
MEGMRGSKQEKSNRIRKRRSMILRLYRYEASPTYSLFIVSLFVKPLLTNTTYYEQYKTINVRCVKKHKEETRRCREYEHPNQSTKERGSRWCHNKKMKRHRVSSLEKTSFGVRAKHTSFFEPREPVRLKKGQYVKEAYIGSHKHIVVPPYSFIYVCMNATKKSIANILSTTF